MKFYSPLFIFFSYSFLRTILLHLIFGKNTRRIRRKLAKEEPLVESNEPVISSEAIFASTAWYKIKLSNCLFVIDSRWHFHSDWHFEFRYSAYVQLLSISKLGLASYWRQGVIVKDIIYQLPKLLSSVRLSLIRAWIAISYVLALNILVSTTEIDDWLS